MRAFLAHLRFELVSAVRSPGQLLMSYLFPLGFYALIGAVMPKLQPAFLPELATSMCVVALMTGTVLALPGVLVEARAGGVFRSFRIHGASAGAVLAAPAVAALLHAAVACAVIAITAPVLFHAPPVAEPLRLVGALAAAGVAFAGVAVVIGVVAGSARTSTLLAQAVFLPSMMLGGIMLPASALPAETRKVAGLLPSTWAVAAAHGDATAALVLVAGGLCACAVVALLFTWDRADRRAPRAAALLALVPYVVAAALR